MSPSRVARQAELLPLVLKHVQKLGVRVLENVTGVTSGCRAEGLAVAWLSSLSDEPRGNITGPISPY